MSRATVAALLFALLGCVSGCYEPPCPEPRASFGPEATLPYRDGPAGTVPVIFRGKSFDALLDTGFRKTAFGPTLEGTVLGIGTLELGGATVTPIEPGALLGAAVEGVIGTDALQTLPFSLDPIAKTARVRAAFDGDGDGHGVALETLAGRCDEEGAEGPAWIVPAAFFGRTRRLLLDTGAELTVIRSGDAPSTPRLSGVRISTAFAGVLTATATRLPSLAAAGEESRDVVALFSPELDGALSGLGDLDGLLGQSFLRDHVVELDGKTAAGDRTLRLLPHRVVQPRHFVGVGINTTRTDAGLRIDGFLSVSPAKEAGLQSGDVITTVDGKAALTATQPWAAPGTTVRIGFTRAGQSSEVVVELRDLLPTNP